MSFLAPPIPTTPALLRTPGSVQYHVRLGLWTNWSRGSVLGQTLTLERQDGNLLIAFTGVFISYVGTRFWQIISLTLHRYYSTTRSREANHHQRQIVLRNANSADSAVSDLIQLHFAWRQHRSILWLLPSITTSLLCVFAFLIAGGFSSQISSSVATEVVLDGTNCAQTGYAEYNDPTTLNNKVDNAMNYNTQCYSLNSSILTDCKGFVTQRIPVFVNWTAPCPFSNGICQSDWANLQLDTGYLDSHKDFGINAPPDQRILFRRALQCAPLNTTGRTTNFRDIYGNRTAYSYGNLTGSNVTANPSFTYVVSSLESQYLVDQLTYTEQENVPVDYLVQSFAAKTFNGSTNNEAQFIPDSDLARADADIYLIFLSGNGVVLSQPANDLWYQANTVVRNDSADGSSTDVFYGSNNAASPLACAEQFQYCRSDVTSCGPLASSADAIRGAFKIFGIDSTAYLDDVMSGAYDTNNNPDASRFQWFAGLTYNYPNVLPPLISSLGPRSLLSTQSLVNGFQADQLAENQWQQDLTYLWSTLLIMQQFIFIESAEGPPVTLDKSPPSNEAQRAMCENQKVLTADYTVFNFFALLFTYMLGFTIIAISFSLGPFLSHLRKRFGCQRYADLEWTTNTALQLHRIVHENVDGEDAMWYNCTSIVPTTEPGVVLPLLDISDQDHPRIQGSSSSPQSAVKSMNSDKSILPPVSPISSQQPLLSHKGDPHSSSSSFREIDLADTPETASSWLLL